MQVRVVAFALVSWSWTTPALCKKGLTDPYAEDVLRVGVTAATSELQSLADVTGEVALFKVDAERAIREAGRRVGAGQVAEISARLSQTTEPWFHEVAHTVQTAREAGSGMATGLALHPGLLDAANEVITAREAGSGMATGRLMATLLDTWTKAAAAAKAAAVQACVAASVASEALSDKGGSTPEGQLAIKCKVIVDRDTGRTKGLSAREAGSGMATGRRQAVAIPMCSGLPGACEAAGRLIAAATDMLTQLEISKVDLSEAQAIVSNPLYQGNNGSATNPLYESKK